MRFFRPVLRFGTFFDLPKSFTGNAAEVASLTEGLRDDRNVRFAMQAGSESPPNVMSERVVLFGQRGNEKLGNGVFATTRSCSHFTRGYDAFALWHRVCLFETTCESVDEVTAVAWPMAEKLRALRQHEDEVLEFLRARSTLKLDAATRTNSMFTVEVEAGGVAFEQQFAQFFPDTVTMVKRPAIVAPLPGLLAIQRDVFRDFVPGITGPEEPSSSEDDPPTETFGTETYRPLDGPSAVLATSRYRRHSSWAAVCSNVEDNPLEIDPTDVAAGLAPRALRLGAAMVHDLALYERIVKGAKPENTGPTPPPTDLLGEPERLRLLSGALRNMSQRSTKFCSEDKQATPLGPVDHNFVDNIKIITISTRIDQHKNTRSSVTTHAPVQKSDSPLEFPPTAIVWKDIGAAQDKYERLLRAATSNSKNEPTIVMFGEFAFPISPESEFLAKSGAEMEKRDRDFIQKIRSIVDESKIILFTGTACETTSYTNCGFMASPGVDPQDWPKIEKRLSAEHLGEFSASSSRYTLKRFEWRGIKLSVFICFDVYDPNAHLSLVRSNYMRDLYDLVLVPSFNEHGGGGDQVLSVCRKISRDAGLVAAYVNAVKAPESSVYINGEEIEPRAPFYPADAEQAICEYDVPIGANKAKRSRYLRLPDSFARAVFETTTAG